MGQMTSNDLFVVERMNGCAQKKKKIKILNKQHFLPRPNEAWEKFKAASLTHKENKVFKSPEN